MSSNPPTVSVVIPARDAADTLESALDSVAAQSYPHIVEVIVAAADEESAQVARDHGASVVHNLAGTTPGGLNLALGSAIGDVIVRCDAQSVLPPDYVQIAVAKLLETGAENVGGMQVPVGFTDMERAIAAAMRSAFGSGNARYRTGGEEGPAETVYLGTYLRATLRRLGGFDERFTRTQDYELNHRIIQSGGLVWFTPELLVRYRPRGSLKDLGQQYYQYGVAKRLFARKHPGSLKMRQKLPPILVCVLGGSLIGALWKPALLVVPLAYASTLLALSASTEEHPVRVAASLGVMHVSWGLGFLTPWASIQRGA